MPKHAHAENGNGRVVLISLAIVAADTQGCYA